MEKVKAALARTRELRPDIKADGEVEVHFKNRRYVFPRHDVLDLPLDKVRVLKTTIAQIVAE